MKLVSSSENIKTCTVCELSLNDKKFKISNIHFHYDSQESDYKNYVIEIINLTNEKNRQIKSG